MLATVLRYPGYPSTKPIRYQRTASRFAKLLGQGTQIASHSAYSQLMGRAVESRELRSAFLTLVHKLDVQLRINGHPMDTPGLFVCNHISWLDAVILAGIQELSFIAKNEVRQWPLVGSIGEDLETVFINRLNKFSVYRDLPKLVERIEQRKSVLFFPEGTTSVGHGTQPFFPMLFQIAVRTGCPVQPIALRYTDPQGNVLPDIAFVDDDTLIDSLLRLLQQERVVAHITYLPSIAGSCRKHLAATSKRMIDQQLMMKSPYSITE